MSPRLADHLRSARRHDIVGREAEIDLFRAALTVVDPPFYLLYVFGPGGIGKTTLLRAYRTIATQAQVPAIHLDSRNVEPSSDAFVRTLAGTMGLATPAALEEAFTRQKRTVLLIDTFERLRPLEGWLRNTFFPQLPEQVLIVLAGRNGLAPEWYLDPGWRSLICRIALRNLSAKESQRYLSQQGVPAAEQEAVFNFTHGHPLALSLIADVFRQRPSIHFQPADVPDVIKLLVEQFVQKVPGPAHRAALESCVLVRTMTEGLLAAMLSLPDVHEIFDWLRDLSFIEAGEQGLFPHDLAREVLLADLRWRNPDWYSELHSRARSYYADRLLQVGPLEQQSILYDYIFLHRDNPLVRPFYEWQGISTVLPDHMVPADVQPLIDMVVRHEGMEAATLVCHWIERQPESFLVFRASDRRPLGFALFLALDRLADPEILPDRAVRKAKAYLHCQAPLRPGETATYFRFWMTAERYQAVSALQSQIFVTMVRHYLTTPGLAFTFLPCADPDFWAPMFAYADLMRLPELDFEVGGRRYGVYGHHWRAVPPLAWLTLLGERELGTTPMQPPTAQERLIVLDASDFATAVHEALKQFTRPPALRTNPLLRSRLVLDRAGLHPPEGERIAALQSAIRAAAETFQTSPKDMKLYRVLHHTYLQPAATQEAAAELLDLPFSTYRRHLKKAIECLADLLWLEEIGA